MSVNNEIKYEISFSYSIEDEKIESLIHSVEKIQRSIDWDGTDLYFARLRLSDPACPKILVRDKNSEELIGYATIVKQGGEKNAWYISQIVVDKAHQGFGVGKSIMCELFKKAIQNNITHIVLDTDNGDAKLLTFYRSFKERAAIIETHRGFDRFGKQKVQITYKLNNPG